MRWLILALIVLPAEGRNCSKGKPCGDTCIARDKACHADGYSPPVPAPTPVAPPVPAAPPPPQSVVAPPAPAPSDPNAVWGSYVSWGSGPTGWVRLTRVGVTPYVYVDCYPSAPGCFPPPTGMPVPARYVLDKLPSDQRTLLTYALGQSTAECWVRSCRVAR